MGRKVDELVGDSVQSAILSLLRLRGSFSAGLAAVDQAVEDSYMFVSDAANSVVDSVKNGKYFKMAMEKLEEVKAKLEELKAAIMAPVNEVHSWGVPKKLQEIHDVLGTVINNRINELWNRPELSSVRDALNRVYQQLKWAREYWQVEQQLMEKLEAAAMTAYDVIMDELKQMQKRSSEFNPITYYNPSQGEIQVCLPLPVAVESLQEMPDLTPLKEDFNKALEHIKQYLPEEEDLMDEEKMKKAAVEAAKKAVDAMPEPRRQPQPPQPPRYSRYNRRPSSQSRGSRGRGDRRQPPSDYRPRRYYRNRSRN